MKRKETIIRIEAMGYTTGMFSDEVHVREICAYTNMDTMIPDDSKKYKVGDVVEVIVR